MNNHPIYNGIQQIWKSNGTELENQYREKLNSENSFNKLFENKNLKKDTIDNILQKLKNFSQIKQCSELLIYLGTWNVAGLCFGENPHIFDWLFPTNNTRIPDLYIIGLQEIVDLNPKNIMFNSNIDRVEYWKLLLSKNLSKIGK